MSLVVFAGPSIHGVPPEELAGFELRPPAACGDLLAAAFENPEAIVLIDGLFEQARAVWHKEILFALAEGIHVWGAASMGALRAAECHAYGMVGVGAIFEAYRSGRRTADSDVAIAHAPAELGYRPLTVALADADAAIEALSVRGVASPEEAMSLGAAARALHFSQRRWAEIFSRCGLADTAIARISAHVKAMDHSQKREDALALLRAVRGRSRAEGSPPAITKDRLARTPFLDALKAEVRERMRSNVRTAGE